MKEYKYKINGNLYKVGIGDIDNGIALENELFAMCFATEDQKEGMGAFLEKRKEKHFQNK